MARQALKFGRSDPGGEIRVAARKIVMARWPAGKHGGASAVDESSG
jgi:hypothetical protein